MDQSKVKLDTMSKSKSILFNTILVILFASSFVVGYCAPPIYTNIDGEDVLHCTPGATSCEVSECPYVFSSITLTHLSVRHQKVSLLATFTHMYPGKDLSEDAKLNITVYAINENEQQILLYENENHAYHLECHQFEGNCDEVTVLSVNYVDYSTFKVFVHFDTTGSMLQGCTKMRDNTYGISANLDLRIVNKRYTKFEALTKYGFFVYSIAVLAYYFYSLSTINAQQHCYIQKWIKALVVLLCFYNDPFFIIQVLRPKHGIIVFNAITSVLFVLALLLFWICAMEYVRYCVLSEQMLEDISFYPKYFRFYLVILFCIGTFMHYAEIRGRLDKFHSPEYHPIEHNLIFKVFFALTCIIYFVSLSYQMTKVSHTWNTIAYKHKYLYYATLFTMLITFIGIAVGAYAMIPTDTIEFFSFHALLNLYITALAVAFSPSKDTYDQTTTVELGTQGIENEFTSVVAKEQANTEKRIPRTAVVAIP